jgi:hypothetical protein
MKDLVKTILWIVILIVLLSNIGKIIDTANLLFDVIFNAISKI